jgi:hypothetical protein
MGDDCVDTHERLFPRQGLGLSADLLRHPLEAVLFELLGTAQKLCFALGADGDEVGLEFQECVRHEQGFEPVDQRANDGKHQCLLG